MKKIINVGIVAHVDAGKTSLTESLYSKPHSNYKQGSIKKGDTITDTLELEKERGITIKTSSVSLEWNETKINLIDMPGHIEFYGEVVRSLNVIDVAVLVVSSLGELPTQTRRIFDTLQEAKIPTIFFLNKIDLETARPAHMISEIENKLSSQLVQVTFPFSQNSRDILIESSSELFDKFMLEEFITEEDLVEQLSHLTIKNKCYPLILGSAVTGVGVETLLNVLSDFELENKGEGKLSAYLYKITFVNGQKQAFFRLLSGSLSKNQSYLLNNLEERKMPRFLILQDNEFVLGDTVQTGDIFMFPKARDLKIQDFLGEPLKNELTLPSPTLKIIFKIKDEERMALLDLLTELAEEDPLLDFVIDKENSEISMKIFGRVQREYIEETLRRRYPFKSLSLSLPTIVYKEVVKEIGEGTIEVDEDLNPYWATMTLKVESSDAAGIQFDSLVTTGYLKQSFQNAIRESVFESTKTGIYDFELTNVKVTLTDAEFFSPVSTPSEFRKLTPYALYRGLLKAKTLIVEPVVEISVSANIEYLGKAISELGKLEGNILNVSEVGNEFNLIAKLPQSLFLIFEENSNELFNGQAYIKNKIVSYEEVSDNALYNRGKVDRVKSLLIKEEG
ncbi:TetM/TetW/TetO/TetS family tetracycline resistance ribosomal protection protein [Vagococcus fluvialis]|uniref:GTP-binding protein n=1 Tax=Vagococcus fluvialis TaxID=2738 RepID=UPI001A8D7DCE|nr:GTP-binding protein [Vagococcus fluvialis]MBO0429773.1 TetM/TetW/TetO/TetS family tetracycline resistance ribosomal protection protein [Vagococcus fluvialis]